MIKIFDISADISPKYGILVPIDTIFAIENRSLEKSEKIDEISPIYRPGTDISIDFSVLGDTRVWGEFFQFLIDISTIYRSLCVWLRLIL